MYLIQWTHSKYIFLLILYFLLLVKRNWFTLNINKLSCTSWCDDGDDDNGNDDDDGEEYGFEIQHDVTVCILVY